MEIGQRIILFHSVVEPPHLWYAILDWKSKVPFFFYTL